MLTKSQNNESVSVPEYWAESPFKRYDLGQTLCAFLHNSLLEFWPISPKATSVTGSGRGPPMLPLK